MKGITAVSRRTMCNGMIRSARGARGITIRGINPQEDNRLTRLEEKIIEGKFLVDGKKNQILISEEIAEKLQLKLRKKIVLQFQDFNGDITAGSFRVAGIFKTGNTIADLGSVLVNRVDLNRLLDNGESTHEMAMVIDDVESLATIKSSIQERWPDLLVEDYRDLSPDVRLYEQQIGISLSIIGTIFMLALIFGIINTMLMAVLERTRELGMLMAVGMNKLRVFGMVVIETIMLGLIGAPIGLLLGWLTIQYFGSVGIDLGAFAEGIEKFGMNTKIFPELSTDIYIKVMGAVLITALLASIYPAIKAIRLRPMEAIRKI
ncbi:MAG: ABC transporter permease [Saprospiraceae bacterium]|nr:ABC transporter permease [Saprospiraceae bacterium]